MCGVFGFLGLGTKIQSRAFVERLVESLFRLSESRGRDAAGLAVGDHKTINVLKKYLTASEFISTEDYKSLMSTLDFSTSPVVKVLGHTRLATNGKNFLELNNQPVVSADLVGIHNGIITNDESLWRSHPELKRDLEVDTELMLKLFRKNAEAEKSFEKGIGKSFEEFEGNVSCAVISPLFEQMYLATNNGSVYYSMLEDFFIFASERLILNEISATFFNRRLDIVQLPPNEVLVVGCERNRVTTSRKSLNEKELHGRFEISIGSNRIRDLTCDSEVRRKNLKRCTKCILPETFPFIRFDSNGVCNYCERHCAVKVRSKSDARAEIERVFEKRSFTGSGTDSLLMLSGGRDSCYGLHYAVKELGLKPIAYTYDWGMVTDIARRNAERMCGELGVEHIIVSADIRLKRENIRRNISAWLKRPVLGMVPIFMAGDKQFLYYGKKIRDANNLPLTVISTCPFEKTGFKTGFAGVDEGNRFIYKIPMSSKLKYLSYFGRQFLLNPRYLNSTLFDSLHGFWSAFLIEHDFLQTFEFEFWDERKVVNTLTSKYNWELDPEAGTSWRIGDGTAAFYNLIYHTLAGFTENDTFRSHQIREGVLDRDEALKLVERENSPRWRSLEWYSSVVGFNLAEAVRVISHAPKLY